MMIPTSCFLISTVLKIKRPMINVKIGVRLFSKPATEESTLICAMAYRKDGMPLPHKPIMIKYFSFSQGTSLKWWIKKGIKAMVAMVILIAPTSRAEKANKDFLININELPHTKLSITSAIQDNNEVFDLMAFIVKDL